MHFCAFISSASTGSECYRTRHDGGPISNPLGCSYVHVCASPQSYAGPMTTQVLYGVTL